MLSRQCILMVEDNPDDYEAAHRSFQKARISNEFVHVEDGDEALDYLFNRGAFKDKEQYPRPGVILLDLNLPVTDGREVLQEVKNDPELCTIPVIVLTTSNDSRDIDACYKAGANTYLVKPLNLKEFMGAMERLKEFWLELAILPREGEGL